MNHIYYSNLKEISWKQIRHKTRIVSKEEEEKIYSFKYDKDRCLSLCGKILLLHALNRQGLIVDDKIPGFEYNSFGKPFIGGCKMGFNISHSGDTVICASASDGILGVDIEQITEVVLDDFKDVLSPSEYDALKMADNVDFFRLWTIKEAVMKADGRGFSLDPLLIHTEEIDNEGKLKIGDKSWFISTQQLDEYMISLASDNSGSPLIENIDIKYLIF